MNNLVRVLVLNVSFLLLSFVGSSQVVNQKSSGHGGYKILAYNKQAGGGLSIITVTDRDTLTSILSGIANTTALPDDARFVSESRLICFGDSVYDIDPKNNEVIGKWTPKHSSAEYCSGTILGSTDYVLVDSIDRYSMPIPKNGKLLYVLLAYRYDFSKKVASIQLSDKKIKFRNYSTLNFKYIFFPVYVNKKAPSKDVLCYLSVFNVQKRKSFVFDSLLFSNHSSDLVSYKPQDLNLRGDSSFTYMIVRKGNDTLAYQRDVIEINEFNYLSHKKETAFKVQTRSIYSDHYSHFLNGEILYLLTDNSLTVVSKDGKQKTLYSNKDYIFLDFIPQ